MAFDWTLFDDWDEPVLLIDGGLTIRHANPIAGAVLGYSSTCLQGMGIDELLPDFVSERQNWMRETYAAHREDRSYRLAVPVTCVHGSGRKLQVWVTFEPAHGENIDWQWLMLDSDSTGVAIEDTRAFRPNPIQITSIRAKLSATPNWRSIEFSKLGPGDERFRAVAMWLRDSVGFNLFGATEVDWEERKVTMGDLAYSDFEPVRGRESGSEFALNGTITEHALATRSAILINRGRLESFRHAYPGAVPIQGKYPFQSSITIPIYEDELPVGAFGVHSNTDIYLPEHVDSLSERLKAEGLVPRS